MKISELISLLLLYMMMCIVLIFCVVSCQKVATPQTVYKEKIVTKIDTLIQKFNQIDTFYIDSNFDTCFAEKQAFNWLVKEYQKILNYANSLIQENDKLLKQAKENQNTLSKLKKNKGGTIIINDSGSVSDVTNKNTQKPKQNSAIGNDNDLKQTKEIGWWKIFLVGMGTGILTSFIVRKLLVPKVTAFSSSIWKYVKE